VFAAKEAAFQNSSSGSSVRKYIIPTYVHIVVSDDGTGMGDVAKDVVEKQVKALNEAYATNSQAAGIQWVFQVQSVVKTSGPDMCDQQNEASMKAKLRKGSRDALNLYVTDLSACGLLGYSSWPWDLKKKGLNMDGVVIHYDTLPGGQYRPYNLGRTGIHEIGHWLGAQLHCQEQGWQHAGVCADHVQHAAHRWQAEEAAKEAARAEEAVHT
jgi:hypothetical protein